MLKFLSDNAGLVIALVILVIFLAVGWRDLLRISPKRVWAISSVGFRESYRRGVLWITPLAMLGIIAVSQLAHPFDEQDAIRQTTKYCLFASGVVVVLATLILACTNLPREIDNRVIYTIVTKPPTRLEIVLGKTLGFARTAGLILLAMGLFSYLYLQINAAQLRGAVRSKLANLPPADLSRETLQHYANEGLLTAKTYARPASLNVYARTPQPNDPVRWFFGASEQYVVFPVDLAEDLFQPDTRLVLMIQGAYVQRPLSGKELEQMAADPTATTKASTQPGQRMPPKPAISVSLMDQDFFNLAGNFELVDAIALEEQRAAGKLDPAKPPQATEITLRDMRAGVGTAVVLIPPKVVDEKLRGLPEQNGTRRMHVRIDGWTMATLYGFSPESLKIFVERPGQSQPAALERKDEKGNLPEPIFRTRLSMAGGQQLRGEVDRERAPVAVYAFRGAVPREIRDGKVPFEFRSKIERGAEADDADAEAASHVEMIVHNHKTGQSTAPMTIVPDVDRPTFFNVPAAALEGGDYDVYVRSRTEGHYVGVRNNSLQAVVSTNLFAYNLLKSLLMLWMLAVLVVIISIFCSTFVSWPIAVVLTLVILLGRWAVNQLGEPATPQQIWTDITGGKTDVVSSRIFTTTLDKLNLLLRGMARVLPDVDSFRVTEDIERGVNIPHRTLLGALVVIGGFGLPVLALSYVFLKKKEVAP